MIFELGHTSHIVKYIIEPIVASPTTIIMSRTNYKSIGPQNDPTFHEHAKQGFHTILNEAQPTFVHLATPIGKNFLVTTLILGSWPRQKGYKGAGQKEAWESHLILSGV
jgi:hypothetical protein